jgi:hypothetical protein
MVYLVNFATPQLLLSAATLPINHFMPVEVGASPAGLFEFAASLNLFAATA